MKIYVHDRIVFLGGGEAMLRTLMQYFGVDEKTKLYVLYSTHDHFLVDGYQVPIVTSLPKWMNKMFAWGGTNSWGPIRRLFDYRNLMFFYPLLCWLVQKKIQQAQPSRVVISSFAAVKNVVPTSGWMFPTTLYLHSPMQYIWENYDEYMLKLGGLKKQLFRFAAWYLRPRDKQSREYNELYANSKYTAQCAEQYYGLQPTVWYPDLNPEFLSTPVLAGQPRDYFVYIGRLVRFIREVDRIILLCNELHLPLLVLGSGPDEDYLKSIAGPTITFIGHVSSVEEKIAILKPARGLINLAKESCGIATMEALSLGVPVFGHATGGTYEIVAGVSEVDDEQDVLVTDLGVLVCNKSPATLHKGMNQFIQKIRNRKTIKEKFIEQLHHTTP